MKDKRHKKQDSKRQDADNIHCTVYNVCCTMRLLPVFLLRFLLLKVGSVFFPLALTHEVDHAGENKESEKEHGAIVVFHDQEIDHAEHAQYGAGEPKAF
jgi:hypothetical protein